MRLDVRSHFVDSVPNQFSSHSASREDLGVDNYLYDVAENVDLDDSLTPGWYAHHTHRSLVLEHDRVHEDFLSRYRDDSLNERVTMDMYYPNYNSNYEDNHYKVQMMSCEYQSQFRGHHMSSSFVSNNSEGFFSPYDHVNPVYPSYSTELVRHLSSEPPPVSDTDLLPQYVRPPQYRSAFRGPAFPDAPSQPRSTRYPGPSHPSAGVHSRTSSHRRRGWVEPQLSLMLVPSGSW